MHTYQILGFIDETFYHTPNYCIVAIYMGVWSVGWVDKGKSINSLLLSTAFRGRH